MLDRLGFEDKTFESTDIGIWIADTHLVHKNGKARRNRSAVFAHVGRSSQGIPADFTSTVREIIGSYRHDRWLTLSEFSDCVDIPLRTIQRRLAEENTSFSDLSIRMRVEAAISLLEDPARPVTEIAMDLGFSTPSNFARAFRSITGFSPNRFRMLSLPACAGADDRRRNTQEST